MGSTKSIENLGRERDFGIQYYQTPRLCLKSKSTSENMSSYMAIDNRTSGSDKEPELSYFEMRNYCLRYGEPEENVTHTIFEYPPALQVWYLSVAPSSPNIFPLPSIYSNTDYLFRRKNSIVEPELDIDPYPSII